MRVPTARAKASPLIIQPRSFHDPAKVLAAPDVKERFCGLGDVGVVAERLQHLLLALEVLKEVRLT